MDDFISRDVRIILNRKKKISIINLYQFSHNAFNIEGNEIVFLKLNTKQYNN